MNTEFQRITRRYKKAFLSDQCKETEEKNKIGNIRNLKKIRDTKGTPWTIQSMEFSRPEYWSG